MMKQILSITLMFAILSIAGIGLATIFDFMAISEAKTLLTRSIAAILFLGVCSALIAALSAKNNSQDT
jgi:hypothetical protein